MNHSIVMEENESAPDTLAEVKKLQDLVRKLERQNQQLRSKQNSKVSSNSPPSIQKYSPPLSVLKSSNINNCDDLSRSKSDGSTTDPRNSIENHNENLNYLDDIDIIRISDVDLSDDDSWLYTSPNGLTPEQKNESPYKWLRKDVDDPENKQLQLAKTALISKLNDLEILASTSPRNHHHHLMANRTISQLRRSHMTSKSPPFGQEFVTCSSIDTRTFTKSKKKQALEYLSSTPIGDTWRDLERNHFELRRRGSDVSLDSSTGNYMLTDASDVQEVARMQEESLRLSSPVGTPKRQSVVCSLSSRRLSVSSRSSVSDLDNTEHPSLMSQISHEGNSVSVTPAVQHGERANYSDHSSQSESPYGSNISLNNIESEKDMSRRSLPNLNRTPIGIQPPKLSSASEMQPQNRFAMRSGPSGHRSDSNLLAEPKSRRKVMSPTRHRLQQPPFSYVSPTSSLKVPSSRVPEPPMPKSNRQPARRLPTKSSGLPKPSRPASASRVLSGIPMPSAVSKKYSTEDSWSDGCF